MYEELISRLKNLAMLTTENGESKISVSAEAVQAIREIATQAADAIEKLSRKEKFHAFLMVFVSGGNGKEDAPSQGGCGGNGKDPTIVYYDATYKTNADRIRAMSDEELASLLMYFADDTDGIEEKDYDAFSNTEWRGRMLRWLKKEVTE